MKNLGGGGGVVKLSLESLSGTLEKPEAVGLKGYQNISAIFDKLEKGEIQEDEIRVYLKFRTKLYKATSVYIVVLGGGEKRFEAYFTGEFLFNALDSGRLGELNIRKYERKNIGIDSTALTLRTFDGQKYDFTAEFTD